MGLFVSRLPAMKTIIADVLNDTRNFKKKKEKQKKTRTRLWNKSSETEGWKIKTERLK